MPHKLAWQPSGQLQGSDAAPAAGHQNLGLVSPAVMFASETSSSRVVCGDFDFKLALALLPGPAVAVAELPRLLLVGEAARLLPTGETEPLSRASSTPHVRIT